eukprot:533304-Ditylum_brightwellii.AAC.1
MNEDIRTDSIGGWCNSLGLRKLIIDRHVYQGHPMVKSNFSGIPIDSIWGTHGVQILAGGYLPFGEVLKSDHRLLW